MNIQIQLCGLFMLALLFIFYKSTKTLHLYKEKIFYRAMCIIIISLCLDILSLASIFLPYTLSSSICQLCMQGLPCHFDMGCFNCAYLFFCGSFHQKKASKNRPLFTYSGIISDGSLTLCLPLDFHNPLHYSPLRLIFLSNFCFFSVLFCTLVV